MLSQFCDKSLAFICNHPSYDPFMTILEGAVRSSKTYTMNPKIFTQLNHYDVAGDRVLFGVSKDTIYKNVLNNLFDFYGEGNYSYNRQSGQLWLGNKEWSVVGAKDEGSEKYIRGRTVGIAYGDELSLTPKTFFEMMLSRMSPTGARFYGTTNPDSPYHYLYTDWITNPKKQHLLRSIKYTLDDNYSLDEETKDRFRTMYSGLFYQRYILGKWVVADGAIYRDSYSESLTYDDESAPKTLKSHDLLRYIPIDYGTGNPTVFLLIIDDGETYWIDREYYHDSRADGVAQKTDKQYVTDLSKFVEDFAPRGAQCIVDPSAASLKAQMTSDGIWHGNAKNEVLDGIRTVASLMAQKKIRIHKRCVKTHSELQTYSWDKNKQKLGEDAPLKQHDHTADALRYFCETIVPKWRIAA